ncbi:hypothetical protein AB0465_11405 [Streptomyces griseoviridis]|uniref:hypothetical protein n=1 Tax=Streptomyces griseoviridis TaxID=45398 RepID=UPI00344E80D1
MTAVTAHRRTARACTIGAGGIATTGTYLTVMLTPGPGLWLAAGLTTYVTVLLAWCAHRARTTHHREVEEADWEQRHERDQAPDSLTPCCLLAEHSRGAAHSHRCTDVEHRIPARLNRPWSS